MLHFESHLMFLFILSNKLVLLHNIHAFIYLVLLSLETI